MALFFSLLTSWMARLDWITYPFPVAGRPRAFRATSVLLELKYSLWFSMYRFLPQVIAKGSVACVCVCVLHHV